MTRIEVFDPPMCCSTGVCGPSVDPLLAAFAAYVEWLTAQGVTVSRYNLSQDPQPFVANTRVLDLMQRQGTACLPIVLVNGDELGHGAYPRREELARAAGLAAGVSQSKPRIRLSVEERCTPGSGCC
jgi:arsenite methyltransferase